MSHFTNSYRDFCVLLISPVLCVLTSIAGEWLEGAFPVIHAHTIQRRTLGHAKGICPLEVKSPALLSYSLSIIFVSRLDLHSRISASVYLKPGYGPDYRFSV